MSLLYFLPLALAALLRSSSPTTAFSPSPSLIKRHRSFGLGYTNDVVVSMPPETEAASLTSPDITIAPKEEEEEDDNQFDWFNTWLPLTPVEFLDREKPIPFKILGIDIVVYNDGEVVDDSGEPIGYGSKLERPKNSRRLEGNWRAFVDRCPHRAAPLSEGRVEEDGTLMCSYHAWRWDGEGDLAHVPQAQDTELERLKKNPKSKCNSFPIKEKNGLLWVWPSAGSDARILSELTPVADMQLEGLVEVEDESRIVGGSWSYRYLPIGWDYFIENIIDPAHTASAHHSVTSNRYTEPRPLFANNTNGLSKDGFDVEFTMNFNDKNDPKDGDVTTLDRFEAPGALRLFTKVGDDGSCHIGETYTSPAKPGWSNVMIRQTVVKTKDGKVPVTGRQTRDGQIKAHMINSILPKWVGHIWMNKFLNQDTLFVHTQERNFHNSGEYTTVKGENQESDKWTDAVLPMSADKGVLLLRKWIQKVSGGRTPFVGDLEMSPVDNEAVFDVYNSHTKYCTSCMEALTNLRKFRSVSFTMAAAVAIWKPAVLGTLGTGAIASLFAGSALLANKIIGLMLRMEYSHTEND